VKRFLFFSSSLVLLLAGLWYADTSMVAPPAPVGTATPLPTHTPEPTPTPKVRTGPRVVVLSLDGAQASRVAAYLADGTMPNLARLQKQGAMAQYALSVDPPLTAPAHASLASGAYPATTGVVADRYHRADDDLDSPVDALLQAPLGAEPVWRTAMREARRTAAVFWPGTSLDLPATLADYTVTYGATDAAAAQHQVSLTEARYWAGAPSSFSPRREGSLTISKDGFPLVHLYLLAVDTTDDGQENYDTFILDRRRQVTATSARLRLGETAPLIIDEMLTSGAYFTLTQVEADQVTLYQSRLCYNQAQPDELVRQVNERFGFYPAGPDGQALQRGWITPEQYAEMAEIQSRWMMSVTTFVLETYKPELLFAWQGAADALQRQFLLVDAGQPGHSAEKAAEYEGYLRRGYALADQAVGELAAALDLAQTTLIVVSDHGVAPVHSQVYLNSILRAHKLLIHGAAPDYPISVSQSKALALASGGAAHIYINLQGRERAGVVPTEEYPKVQDAIIAALSKVTGEDGQPVFSRLLRRDEVNDLNLGAPAVGDVFVQAAPGYALSDSLAHPGILGPAERYGEAGYDATRPEMQAIFLAAGRRIRVGPEVGPVHILDLAPTVSHLLGLKAPESPEGRVLEEMLVQ